MKLKTHQASNKRFKLTRKGKFVKRKNGQGHFNSRDSGLVGVNKRRDIVIDKAVSKTLNALNPYHL